MIETEAVEACPVCRDPERHELYSGLEDRLFGSPGRWTLHACAACGSAYLDPRPAGSTLQHAYATYYTHGDAGVAEHSGKLRRVRRALKNSYVNAALGYRLRPAVPFAHVLLAAAPLRRRVTRLALRDLPFPRNPSPRLLDVGCGNGAFMLDAEAAGWMVEGIDTDAEALRSAREAGLRVWHGRVEDAPFEAGRFDAITLHHVLEHVQNPRATIKLCRSWLKPEGRLWIATPNLDAPGRRRYGRDWRGLDVPRHLVLFTPKSLRFLLSSLGLDVRFLPPAPSHWMYEASDSLRGGRTPLRRVRSLLLDRRCLRRPTQGEELVVVATPL